MAPYSFGGATSCVSVSTHKAREAARKKARDKDKHCISCLELEISRLRKHLRQWETWWNGYSWFDVPDDTNARAKPASGEPATEASKEETYQKVQTQEAVKQVPRTMVQEQSNERRKDTETKTNGDEKTGSDVPVFTAAQVQAIIERTCKSCEKEAAFQIDKYIKHDKETIQQQQVAIADMQAVIAKLADGVKSKAVQEVGETKPSTVQPKFDERFPPGTRVRLQGLRKRGDLNGHEATVVSFDSASGRYGCQLLGNHGSEDAVKCKPENLRATGS